MTTLPPRDRRPLRSIAAALLAFCAACGTSPAPEPAPPRQEPAPNAVSTAAPDSSPPAVAEPTPTTDTIASATPWATATPSGSPTAAPATATPSATAAPTKPPGRTYIACGCGCCGGVAPDQSVCVDRAKGETLDAIIARDKAARQRPSCRMAGCSIGIEYKECD